MSKSEKEPQSKFRELLLKIAVRLKSRKTVLAIIGFCLVSAGFGVMKYMISVYDEERMARTEFQSIAEIAAEAVATNLKAISVAPKMIASSMQLNPTFEWGPWYRFVIQKQFSSLYDLYLGIIWAPRILKADRAAYEQDVQTVADSISWWKTVSPFPNWQILEKASNGSNVRAGDRDEYFVYQINMATWTTVNWPAWGFDMLSDKAARGICANRSRSTGEATVPQRSQILLPGSPYGLNVCIPVYWNHSDPSYWSHSDPNHRDVTQPRVITLAYTPWAAGVVAGTLQINVMLQKTLEPLQLSHASVFLYDIAAGVSSADSYLGHFIGPGGKYYSVDAIRFAGQSAPQGDLIFSMDFVWEDRPLRVIVASNDGYLQSERSFVPIVVLALSILASLSGYVAVKGKVFYRYLRQRFSRLQVTQLTSLLSHRLTLADSSNHNPKLFICSQKLASPEVATARSRAYVLPEGLSTVDGGVLCDEAYDDKPRDQPRVGPTVEMTSSASVHGGMGPETDIQTPPWAVAPVDEDRADDLTPTPGTGAAATAVVPFGNVRPNV